MKKAVVNENQLSFFDLIKEIEDAPKIATSMFDGQKLEVFPIKDWMARLLPQGEGYVLCANHPLVLCRTDEEVTSEMKYRHFIIDGNIYAATGVGKDEGCDEEEAEDCADC